MMGRPFYLLIALLLLLAPMPAVAQEVCEEPSDMLSGERWLRAISLDLQGVPPSAGDYEAFANGTPIEDFVQAYLYSEGFGERVVRQHRKLMWNEVANVRVYPPGTGLGSNAPYYNKLRGKKWRGDNESCLKTVEMDPTNPAHFDADGTPLPLEVDEVAGTQREGYVWVKPYWGEDPIKVCAFDAQERLFTPDGISCAHNSNHIHCGCGPELRWCRQGTVHRVTAASMGESMDRFVADVILNDRPYLDLFTAKEMWVNGPISYFYRFQTENSGPAAVYPNPTIPSAMPDLKFTDETTWVQVPLGSHHAGILTHPAFLLRFQTRRARANRFLNAFVCAPLQPPSDGLPPATDIDVLNPDLQKRAGCKYCHALLEPAGAYWGRWIERGAGYLNPVDFPSTREDCLLCSTNGSGCSKECSAHYMVTALTSAETPYLGQLQSYAFMAPTHAANIEDGPAEAALNAVNDGSLPRCVAQQTSEWLLGRTLAAKDTARVDALAQDFVASGFSYRELVAAIVTSDAYRRVR